MHGSTCNSPAERVVIKSYETEECGLLLYPYVGPHRYIGDMKEIPDSNEKALFLEVPTPVNAMSAEEKRDFAEEILRALEGK